MRKTVAFLCALVAVTGSAAAAGFTVETDSDWNQGTFSDTEVWGAQLQLNDTGVQELWRINHSKPTRAIAIDSTGYIYAGGETNDVEKIDSNGVEDTSGQWPYTGHSNTVNDVAVDDSDRIYSVSKKDHELHRIAQNGNQDWSRTHGSVAAVTFGPNGHLYTAAVDGTVRKWDTSGNQIWQESTSDNALRTVGVDQSGNVYAGDTQLHKISSSGSLQWSKNVGSKIDGLDVSEDGYIYTVDKGSPYYVRKIDSSGNEIWSYDGHNDSVRDVDHNDTFTYSTASHSDDSTHKIDSTGSKIWRFYEEGSWMDIDVIGKYIYTSGYGPEHFSPRPGQTFKLAPLFATPGDYQSQQFDAGSTVLWSNASVESTLSGQSATLTVEYSSDGFSSVKASESFTLSGGSETFTLTESAQYARFTFDLSASDTATTPRISMTELNYAGNDITTTDNYTDFGWKPESQTVKLTCDNNGNDCDKIEFRIVKGGSLVREGNRSGTETNVEVGDTTDGDLTLEYRGWDNGIAEGWNSQSVRVDTQNPANQLLDNTTWYSNDFTRTTDDNDSLSGVDSCEYRTKDGSDSWSSWKSRSCGDVTVSVDTSSAECTTEGSDECGVRVRTTDMSGNTETKTQYYNIDLSAVDTDDDYTDSGWEPSSQTVGLTCSDGPRDCDQIEFRIWKSGSVIRQENRSGTTTDVDVGSTSDGDLTLEYRGYNDGEIESWEQQRVRVDTGDPSNQLLDDSNWYGSDFTKTTNDADSVSGLDYCEYQTRDGDHPLTSWSSWKSRSCGDVTVTVDPSSGECTEEGWDECGVRVRAVDRAGNSVQKTEWYNIEYSDIDTTDNYTDSSWMDEAQWIRLTCSEGPRDCDQIDWEIVQGGSVLRSDSVSNTQTAVEVGRSTDGHLTLRYRGHNNGDTEDWQSQNVRIDTEAPNVDLDGSIDWYNDDFTRNVTENDTYSEIADCQYRTKDDGNSWTSWKSRSCDQVNVTVDDSGVECTTEGNDECGVRVRTIDYAGNVETDTKYYNIDLTPIDTEDNYSSTKWKNKPQWITLTCEDGHRDCIQIDWEIRKGGSVVRSGTDSGTETAVYVGNQTDGELTLRYRGWDIYGNAEDPWDANTGIRVDTKGPTTTLLSPNASEWQTDDFNATVDDTEGNNANLGKLDTYYLIDTSGSFDDEWSTLANNINDIEDEVENQTSVDMKSIAWGLNNTVPGQASGQNCGVWQTDVGHCDHYRPVIDDISNVEPYTDWLGIDFQDYDYRNINGSGDEESLTEGWGAGELDVVARDEWRDDSVRSIINVGDADTNGYAQGHPNTCGDTNSWNLANYLNTTMRDKDIKVFSMLGNPECTPDPSNQMNTTSISVEQYSDADELPDEIIDVLSGEEGIIEASNCYYQINDGGSGWTGWMQRDNCPHTNQTITVGQSGSGADCTTDGVDTCEVRVKVNDTAGHDSYDYRAFNVDAGPPLMGDNYTDNGWKNEPQWVEITCSDPGSGCARIDWRIKTSGSTVRNGTAFDNVTVVDVGTSYNGDLTLEYKGYDISGNSGGWQSQDVRVDTGDPSTNITGPNETKWLEDDFNVTIEDADTGGSGINTAECEYRVKDGTDPWTAWQSRSCPDGNITITTGTNASADCTTDGKNACKLKVKIADNAANEDFDNASFDLDAGPPRIICEDDCAPDVVFSGSTVTFSPTIPENESGDITVNICDNEDCLDITCGFDPGDRANCSGVAPNVPVRKEFHIIATDSKGRKSSFLGSYTVKGQVNDYCTQDQDCVSTNCHQNECQPSQKPPLIEIYAPDSGS